MANISALDLLTVPAMEQDILRCLIRTPEMTAKQIAKRLRRPLTEVEGTLREMEGQSRLTSVEESGQLIFKVPLTSNRTQKRSTNLLDSLFG